MELWQPQTAGSAIEKLTASARAASEAGDNRALKTYEVALRNVQLEETLRSSRFQEKVANDQMRRAQWEIDQKVKTAADFDQMKGLLVKMGMPPDEIAGYESMTTTEGKKTLFNAYLSIREQQLRTTLTRETSAESRNNTRWQLLATRKFQAAQSGAFNPEAMNLLEFATNLSPDELQKKRDALILSDEGNMMFDALLAETFKLEGKPWSVNSSRLSGYVTIAYPQTWEKTGAGATGWLDAQLAKISDARKQLGEAQNLPKDWDWSRDLGAAEAEVRRIYGGMVPKRAVTPESIKKVNTLVQFMRDRGTTKLDMTRDGFYKAGKGNNYTPDEYKEALRVLGLDRALEITGLTRPGSAGPQVDPAIAYRALFVAGYTPAEASELSGYTPPLE